MSRRDSLATVETRFAAKLGITLPTRPASIIKQQLGYVATTGHTGDRDFRFFCISCNKRCAKSRTPHTWSILAPRQGIDDSLTWITWIDPYARFSILDSMKINYLAIVDKPTFGTSSAWILRRSRFRQFGFGHFGFGWTWIDLSGPNIDTPVVGPNDVVIEET